MRIYKGRLFYDGSYTDEYEWVKYDSVKHLIEKPAHEPDGDEGDFKRFLDEWLSAYPLDLFPQPDFDKVHALLKASGLSLDCVSAANFRHVLTRVREKYAGTS